MSKPEKKTCRDCKHVVFQQFNGEPSMSIMSCRLTRQYRHKEVLVPSLVTCCKHFEKC